MTELVIVSKSELEVLIRNAVSEVLKSVGQLSPIESEGEKLNQKQAATYLGITQSTLIRWKKLGLVPYEQIRGSSKIFFYKSQLKHVIQQNPKLLQAARN